MTLRRIIAASVACGALAAQAHAQPPPSTSPSDEPPPLWDVQLGASFVGTNGNSQSSSFGANFEGHRRWPLWVLDGVAGTVHSSANGVETAAQYFGAVRVRRTLTERISGTSGLRLERDRLSGVDFRSVLDGGLAYAIVKEPLWTVDGLSSLAWRHEDRVTGETLDNLEGVLGLTSKYLFGQSGDTVQRFAFYPNLSNSTAYRSEAEVTAQAAMNKRLALKFGFLWRYSHDPVPGFKRSDTTTTASIVMRWRSAMAAP